MKYRVRYKTKFQGLPIAIENDAGEYRYWYDPDTGQHGSTQMVYPYGYVENTTGLDGDEVDVFLGPEKGSTRVFVITQLKRFEFEDIDEQKVMLGFNNSVEAKTAYLRHFDEARFFGSMKEMSIGKFREKLKSREGKLIKSALKNYKDSAKMRGDNMLFLDVYKANKDFKPSAPKPGSEEEEKVSYTVKANRASRALDEKEMDLKKDEDEEKDEEVEKKFKSEAQRKYMYSAADKGEVSKETVKEFEEKTPKNAELPEKVNKSFSSFDNIVKALKASAIAGLSRRERLDAAYQAGMAAGQQSPLQAEPVEIPKEQLNIGVEKSRPLYEPPVVPSRRVETPFRIPPKECQDHTSRNPAVENAEGTKEPPTWGRG